MDINDLFDDSAYLEYKKHIENEVRDLDVELPVPQYINDLRNQTYKAPEVILISSDEEDTPSKSDSDDTYYTASSQNEFSDDNEVFKEDHIEITTVDATHNYNTTDLDNQVESEADDEDDDVIFLYEKTKPKLNIKQRPKFRRKRKASKQKIKMPRIKKPKKEPKVAKKNKKAQKYRIRMQYSAIGDIFCLDCHVLTNRNEESFSCLCRISHHADNYCFGCASLRCYFPSKEEYADVIKWFVTGKIPHYDMPTDVTVEEMVRKLKNRRNLMVKRVRMSQKSDASSLVTTNELYQLCIERNFRCAITGNSLFFADMISSRTPYWSLSLDHIDPLKSNKDQAVSWSKDNIQLMSGVLNGIKGHKSDSELRYWYSRFLQSRVVEL